jgi:hypothetical protein
METKFYYSIHKCLPPFPILSPYQRINLGLRHQFIFHNMIRFYGGEVFTTHQNPKLEYYPLAAVHDCLFNIFAATLHIGGCSSIHNLRMCHAMVTGNRLSWLYSYYDGFIITNDSEYVLSVCTINTTAFFPLDMVHS